jgi:hypothetical protein
MPDEQPVFESISPTESPASGCLRTGSLPRVFPIGFQLALGDVAELARLSQRPRSISSFTGIFHSEPPAGMTEDIFPKEATSRV